MKRHPITVEDEQRLANLYGHDVDRYFEMHPRAVAYAKRPGMFPTWVKAVCVLTWCALAWGGVGWLVMLLCKSV